MSPETFSMGFDDFLSERSAVLGDIRYHRLESTPYPTFEVGDISFQIPIIDIDSETVFNVIHDVLTCAADAPGVAGGIRMARILTGNQEPSDHDALVRMPINATTNNYPYEPTQSDCLHIIDEMIAKGVINNTPGIRQTIVVTRRGFELLQIMDAG